MHEVVSTARGSVAGRTRRAAFPKLLAVALLLAGLLLRIVFLRRYAFFSDDSNLYQDIAQSWLQHHVYGLSAEGAPRPTLIRLPGYPATLAALSWIFDRFLHAGPGTLRSFLPVLWLQIIADLGTCVLAAKLTKQLLGQRAALATLALACLCPFTANYTVVPLTETFTLCALTLAFAALARWLRRPRLLDLVLLAVALSCGALLRPDGGLLALAVLPAMALRGPKSSFHERLWPVALVILLASVPFVGWTVRNYRTFHVVQPLAPRLAVDVGETAPVGFQAWYRTWAIDFSSTEDAYWNYPDAAVLVADLPNRAFDSASERTLVTALLQQTTSAQRLNPAVERQFASLARQRAHAHPLRTFVLLPVARVLDMLVHPRIEMLPIAERWWQFRQHPKQTLFAWAYAAWNLAYLLAAAAGCRVLLRRFRRGSESHILVVAMLAYVGLRCALLMTLDNAEQRYTLEFFPILFVFAGALWARRAGDPA